MVSKTKKFNKGEVPSATDLVEEVSKESESKLQEKEEVKLSTDAPSAEELKEKKKKDVENLTQELVKKGSLRK